MILLLSLILKKGSISAIIQVAYNIMISGEMAMAYDPLESGFLGVVYVCPH
jgi:hypothetical protein